MVVPERSNALWLKKTPGNTKTQQILKIENGSVSGEEKYLSLLWTAQRSDKVNSKQLIANVCLQYYMSRVIKVCLTFLFLSLFRHVIMSPETLSFCFAVVLFFVFFSRYFSVSCCFLSCNALELSGPLSFSAPRLVHLKLTQARHWSDSWSRIKSKIQICNKKRQLAVKGRQVGKQVDTKFESKNRF